jgi:hypothetical protein
MKIRFRLYLNHIADIAFHFKISIRICLCPAMAPPGIATLLHQTDQ